MVFGSRERYFLPNNKVLIEAVVADLPGNDLSTKFMANYSFSGYKILPRPAYECLTVFIVTQRIIRVGY